MAVAGHARRLRLLVVAGWLATAASGPNAAAASQGAAPARLTLRASARVAGSRVMLADIVGEALPPQWADLALAYAPAPGATLELSAALVRRKLAMGAPGAPPRLSGAAACRVQRAELATAADAVAVQARMLQALAPVPLPAGAVAQRFALLTAPTVELAGQLSVQLAGAVPAVGSAAVRFHLTDQRGASAAAQVVVTRSLRVRAWVVARQVGAGTPLTSQDLLADTVWVDTPRAWNELVKESDWPAGCKTTRAVAAGTPLSRSDLRRSPVVQRGNRVAWIVRRGRLLVTVRATARSDGAIGDQVWIESPFDRSLRRLAVVGPALVGDALPPGREPSLLTAMAEDAAPGAVSTQKELP